MEILRAPLNVWNKDSIRPGPVGSVGDVLLGVRFKQSQPDSDMRWDPQFSNGQEVYNGANISDGTHAGFTTGGGVAKTLRQPFGYRPGFKTAIGWERQDIVPVDRSRTSMMSSAGQYSWDSKVGRVNNAASTGKFFTPLPGGYGLEKGQIPRGGNDPIIIASSNDIGIPLRNDPLNIVQLDQYKDPYRRIQIGSRANVLGDFVGRRGGLR